MTTPSRFGPIAALALAGCFEPRFAEPVEIKTGTLDPEELNEGQEAFMLYCFACHGENGEGNGPSSPGLRPPPRDLTQGVFKFAGVEAGELPHDEDLERTIRRGLDGTPMLPWDITDRERHAIVQYIKTLSPRWTKRSPAERILPTPDPWRDSDDEAALLGKRIYHLRAQCSGCHPSYVTRRELASLALELNGVAMTTFPPEMYRSTPRESQFSVNGHKMQILPPDFLFHRVKNGTELDELYRTVASGIGGTAMPMWRGALPEDDLWALIHYVKSLIDIRDTDEGNALRRTLASQSRRVD
ncbi:MAG: c-type cytochrome [Deltaproteobacteria bacterium]|nr:c-type cytochrome [Deltaproteobacteria bacterium]